MKPSHCALSYEINSLRKLIFYRLHQCSYNYVVCCKKPTQGDVLKFNVGFVTIKIVLSQKPPKNMKFKVQKYRKSLCVLQWTCLCPKIQFFDTCHYLFSCRCSKLDTLFIGKCIAISSLFVHTHTSDFPQIVNPPYSKQQYSLN